MLHRFPITHRQWAASFDIPVPPEAEDFLVGLTPNLAVQFFFVPPDELLITHLFDVN